MAGKRVIIHIKSLEEFKEHLEKAGPDTLIVVDFHATWCGPCKNIAPAVEEIPAEVVVLKVDVDECPDVTNEYDIKAMPTFIFFKAKAEVGRFSGADKNKLYEKLAEYK